VYRTEDPETESLRSRQKIPEILGHQKGSAIENAVYDEIISWVSAHGPIAEVDRDMLATNQ